MRILVTGATGFVGRSLCLHLMQEGWHVRGTLLPNESASALSVGVDPVLIEPLGPTTPYESALEGVDIVIHLAARVHVMRETASDPISEFRATNASGSANLALQAAQHGVKRFIFMSTIGVNGDNSGTRAFTALDHPNPHNPYSISKLEAERSLMQISQQCGIEVVIIRAPLVYGPGNPGNFLSLLRVVSKGVPLPLASIANKRSLIYIGNLVDVLAACVTHPAAAGKTYLVSDGENMSTPELIRRTATALCVPARLFPLPVTLLRLACQLTGRGGAANQIMGSLTVDSSKVRQELGWLPPFSVEDGLRITAEWFKKNKE